MKRLGLAPRIPDEYDKIKIESNGKDTESTMENQKHWSILITEGEVEPWYFLDGWEKQIKEQKQFTNSKEAMAQYKALVEAHRQRFDHYQIKGSSIACFWNDGEEVYCEACDEFLQVYHGILLFYQDRLFEPSHMD
ncbi:DUF1033 family protein [Anoxybacillus rupiensis]|uniref:DUF1033 family protein n=2 Tax=Anoxybacteroides rupiense TaxID=311460 RepID=A0ABT5VZE6_9BACL|nr:DUF1033 family protein [Anoxybacillus rupiensis]